MAAGYAGYRFPHDATAGASSAGAGPDAASVSHFVSRPDLQPPAIRVTRLAGATAPPTTTGPSYVALSPKGYEANGPGQAGVMLMDQQGGLVWFSPHTASDAEPFDLQVQSLGGQRVLTWWEGSVVDGHGRGRGYIADSSYQTIAEVRAGNGLDADLHELNLTSERTALITAYRTATTDLSALGGSTQGTVYACQAQEIDVATGKVLFSWDSLDHVPVTDSYTPLPAGRQTTPLDYFHMNSISLAADGNLLISARATWTVYKVDRSSGEILWRLNGKHSDFSMGDGARFSWQHHVRAISGNRLTIFDDAAAPQEEPQSRGIVVSVDESTGKAELVQAFTHPAHLLAANQGSMQLLADGGAFVGWGDQPYYSRFAADGTLVIDARLPDDDQSYRALLSDWEGRPARPPDVAVRHDSAGGATVYASWNGATGIDRWRVLAGESASSLRLVSTVPQTGFETEISVSHSSAWFAVVALDAAGTALGQSAPARLA